MTNPLRQSEPSTGHSLYDGKFYFADAKARLANGSLGTRVHVTPEFLWVTDELAIPLSSIVDVQLLEKGWVPKRRALAVSFQNPITGEGEVVFLCKPDAVGIGLYRVQPLHELMRWIEQARASAPAVVPVVQPSDASAVVTDDFARADKCEVCGARPATYITYAYLISIILISYRSQPKRRIHCQKHNLLYGLPHYLLTVLTGWCGIGVFGYPFMVFGTARSLTPAIGNVTYVLGLLPTLALTGVIAWWIAA